jgi:hypothetical protein
LIDTRIMGEASHHLRRAARHPDERLMHQEIVSREYLKGRYQVDIAADLGISLATLKRDLTKVRKAWLNSALRDFDALKAEQLAKIDVIEAEAWAMWSRTCEVQVRTSEQDIPRGANPGRHIKTDRAQGTGDPRYLQTALQCVEKRCKVLGLYAPDKFAQTDAAGTTIAMPDHYDSMSDEELQGRVLELEQKSADAKTDAEIRQWVEDMTRERFTATPLQSDAYDRKPEGL